MTHEQGALLVEELATLRARLDFAETLAEPVELSADERQQVADLHARLAETAELLAELTGP